MNADLHCHSTVSDGTLAPEVLAARAHANGVELWALTDHDEIGGQQRARDAALALGLPYLTGTEISVTFADTTVHIVGLGFDPDDAGAARRPGRDARRAQASARCEMAEGLARAGIEDAFEGALQYVGNPELISRTHFARSPGRERRLRRHHGGVPPLPDRGPARLRAAPLGRRWATRCAGSPAPAASR